MSALRHRSARVALPAVLLACAAVSPAAGGAPLPRDVRVTDVTPVSFTVVWTVDVPSTGSVEVYEDVLGATPAAGAVVEPSPMLGGDPAAATAAEDLGVVRVRVRGLEPGTPWFFRTLTTPKAGGPADAVPAAGALYSALTAVDSSPDSARTLGADVVDVDGTTPLPGSLVLVSLPGASHPLSAIAGDGYAGALATVDLGNLYDSAGVALPTAGGEVARLEAHAGTTARAELSPVLDVNDGTGRLQRLGAPLVLQAVADGDLDGMPDDWESVNGLDPGVNDAAGDADLDGLTNLEEYERGADPQSADSDGDGLSDGDEVNVHGTLPAEPDTDRDGRPDGDEVVGPTFTDPLDADSDDDGVGDGDEVANGADPNDPGDFPMLDGDGDGVGDLLDNCPAIPNPAQTDSDLDGDGDSCDGDDDDDGIPDGPDNCPRDPNAGQEDDDADGIGNACDNCPDDPNDDQTDNDVDGTGDVCDPDDDNDGVDDFQPAPVPSDIPFELVDATGIVSTSLPVVGDDTAFVNLFKFFIADQRSVLLGTFNLKTRTYTPQAVPPPDDTATGWLAIGVDPVPCDCFPVVSGDSITVATDAGNVTAVLPPGAEDLGVQLLVSDDGSTYGGFFLPSGPLFNLLQSSQVPGPLDNCPLVANPAQTDTDMDGIGDACDITADDLDGDNVPNADDNCPNDHNPGQEDFDLDGPGDACDGDDDNDGVDDDGETGLLLTDPKNADTDGDGIPDGDEDFDFDGRSNAAELAQGDSPFQPDVELRAGLNLFAYPVQVPGGLTAFGLLAALGDDTEVVGLRRLDPLTQTYEQASYAGGVPAGVDFAIASAEGYLVEMLADKTVTFAGSPGCPTHDLVPGANLIGFPCVPGGFTSHDLAEHFGLIDDNGIGATTTGVTATQVFDAAGGRFETTPFTEGLPLGPDVPIHAGQGVFVFTRDPRSAVAPPIAPPVVAITNPLDMDTLDTTPVTVLGTVDPPDAAVDVNGVPAVLDGAGGFSAAGVDLVEGANVLTATARSVDYLESSDSIQVTYDPAVPVDYTLNRPDSVTDTATFNIDPAILPLLDHIHATSMNVPFGVTFTPDPVTLGPTGQVDAPFTISTAADALVGVHMFSVLYEFHDAAHAELASHTLNFTIEVLP